MYFYSVAACRDPTRVGDDCGNQHVSFVHLILKQTALAASLWDAKKTEKHNMIALFRI